MTKIGYLAIPIIVAASAIIGDYANVNRLFPKSVSQKIVKEPIVSADYGNKTLEAHASDSSVYLSYDGKTYDVNMGPLGPRIGSIEYETNNMTNPEKVLALDNLARDLPDIGDSVFNEMWTNRRAVYKDILTKLNDIVRGDTNGTN